MDETVVVYPLVPTTYNVVVTDANGCQASDDVFVDVIDVTCGNKNKKVEVCHIPPGNPSNAHVICISKNAVPAHLENGDHLGYCGNPCLEDLNPYKSVIAEPGQEHSHNLMEVFPNPSNGSFITKFILEYDSKLELRLINVSGKRINTYIPEYYHTVTGIVEYEISTSLQPGYYTLQLVTEEEVLTTSIIITR